MLWLFYIAGRVLGKFLSSLISIGSPMILIWDILVADMALDLLVLNQICVSRLQ